MKKFRHFWRYLAKFSTEWELFWKKVVEKMKTDILWSITFFRKSHRLWNNVEKYCGDRGATNDVTMWRIRDGLARLYALMRMHTPTHPGTNVHACTRKHAHTDQYVILIAFPQQQWFLERASMLHYTYIACLVIHHTTLPNIHHTNEK